MINVKHKKLFYSASAAAAALVTVAWLGLAQGDAETATPITRTVSRGDIVQAVSATGTLEAVTTVQVGSQVSGTVQTLGADFNSIVRKGEVIATLEPSLFDTQVQQARANLIRAQSDLERLQVAAADAAAQLERARQLSEKQLISPADLDAADIAKRSADAQVRSAEAGVTQARAALGQNEVSRAKTVITSPIDGIVTARNVDVGQTVAASVQAPTLFVIAADLREMELDASIDESDVSVVREGQDVRFTVGAYPDETFHGTVRQLRLNPVVDQNVVTYTAVIAVPNPDLKLKPGMTATATIEIDKRANVLRVPNGALQYRPEGESKGAGSEVWVQSGKAPVRVSLKTGLSDGTYTEIVSENLPAGTAVITGSQIGGAKQQQRTSAPSANPFSGAQQQRVPRS